MPGNVPFGVFVIIYAHIYYMYTSEHTDMHMDAYSEYSLNINNIQVMRCLRK